MRGESEKLGGVIRVGVGDELGGGGGAEVDDCLGGVGEELLAVVVFEDFVGAVFACALEGVADEGWGLAVLV